jgi:hypothetical protein
MLNVGVSYTLRFSHKENIGETPESDIMMILCSDVRSFVQCQGGLDEQ